MSIDSHLIHTADFQRATSVKDSYNAERQSWTTNLEGERCRLVIKQQRVSDTAFAERPVITVHKLFVRAGVDVRQGDRVINIADESGIVDAGPFRIEEVMLRRARAVRHISLSLERVG